ncbi:DUF2326 domain-containing protein [Pseudomonas sp. MAFF 301514]|uniref:DUF2326 domain-containing protein n=1 Tax=Pseudomonas allii TaxID=2740531 RepID=A0A7Y8RNK1_9PSED|nr:DUF2326 domain-containing protein [Pseudomonas allii]NWN48007.1 DUF2326 domain-containing protein [Pseudomonas allii]NWN62359.1 DUF2326 domain-containing protein [Pseudomonas allii]
MLKIRRLYSEPQVFDPIFFHDGINLILGETTEGNVKTNGVGKSMAIEFINYGLLKRHEDSRVSLIPNEAFPHSTLICLDFEINLELITIKRSIENHKCPILIAGGKTRACTDIEDASKYLTALLFGSSNDESIPSFRAMLGPLIRDERSEFKSIIKCFDTNKNIPPDYTPHLFLLNIDPKPYKQAKALLGEIDKIGKAISKAKENIVAITGKNVSEAKADLNELTSQVVRIHQEMERLENIEGYDIVKDEIIEIEAQLEVFRSRQAVIKTELSRIKLFRGDNYIDEYEVAELYNQFKEGLGDLIKKQIEEVTAFKKRIDNFQKTLIDGRRKELESSLKDIDARIFRLDQLYREKLSLIDQKGALKNLRQTIAAYQRKVEDHASLSAFIKKYADYEREKKEKTNERDGLIYLLDSLVANSSDVIDSLEQTILDIHEDVAGNRLSSFEVEVTKKKEIIKFELRIYDDGSHSNEREKVFLYDVGLLTNVETSKRHPGLLVHDNIFDVDYDTLIKSLNYLSDNRDAFANKQYILTLNSDKIHDVDINSGLRLDLEGLKRAAFTKTARFLKASYQELS